MAKKDWLLELGERSVNPMDADELLKSKVSERKRKEIERQEELDEATHKAKLAEMKKKETSADAAVEKTEGKKETEGPVKFEVKGGVNLGQIDLQKEKEEAAAELRRMRQEADNSAKIMGQENQQLRERIHEQENKVLEITLKTQIEQLTDIVKSNASKGTFMDQYNMAMEMAKTLGFSHPQGAGDLAGQIELKKLEFEQARELRRLSREDKAEERRWQIELRRLDDDREFRKQEIEHQKRRDEMIASAPEILGRAVAKGFIDSGGGSETESAGSTLVDKKSYIIEADMNDAGEQDCPQCGEVIAIGPTAQEAVCSSCQLRIPIKRNEVK